MEYDTKKFDIENKIMLDAQPGANNLWNKYIKPPADICPKEFCFMWDEEDGCPCLELINAKCFRETGNVHDEDLYEPCDPHLEQAGLPWFYFTASVDDVVEERREEYLRESAKLWNLKE